jgi:hypothetical protein
MWWTDDMNTQQDIIDTSPNISTELAKYRDAQTYFDTLLRDMFTAHEMSRTEYDKLMSERLASYTQFRNDLLANQHLSTQPSQ